VQKSEALLAALGLSKAELSLLFVNDEEIKELNRKYRKKDKPTNVLSFPMGEGNILGDIVISWETAQREAKECGFSLEEMIDFYLIHGLLHLLGYHHDHPDHEKMMHQLWKVLGHTPYW